LATITVSTTRWAGRPANDRRRAQHADLGGIDAHIGKQGVELQPHERRIDRTDAGHSLGVLRGERGDHAAAMRAVRGKGAQVGEQSGATGRVDTGDRQDVGDVWSSHAREHYS
jgi:hypothetical protein